RSGDGFSAIQHGFQAAFSLPLLFAFQGDSKSLDSSSLLSNFISLVSVLRRAAATMVRCGNNFDSLWSLSQRFRKQEGDGWVIGGDSDTMRLRWGIEKDDAIAYEGGVCPLMRAPCRLTLFSDS
ncbi:hypothetical protein Lal_00031566, partial [Lupinus albus]